MNVNCHQLAVGDSACTNRRRFVRCSQSTVKRHLRNRWRFASDVLHLRVRREKKNWEWESEKKGKITRRFEGDASSQGNIDDMNATFHNCQLVIRHAQIVDDLTVAPNWQLKCLFDIVDELHAMSSQFRVQREKQSRVGSWKREMKKQRNLHFPYISSPFLLMFSLFFMLFKTSMNW